MRSLFDSGTDHEDIPDIPGLRYVPEYIDDKQHDRLIEIIDNQDWITELRRRVQHYGYKYGYGKQSTLDYLGKLPRWAAQLATQLKKDKLVEELPDQLIVNEYQPGQGIAAHIDREKFFKDTILSLSLGSKCVMDFIHSETREKASLLLVPKSLLILQGEARHVWKHGIAPRKTDTYRDERITRDRRVSLTFRKVIEGNTDK